MSKEPTTNRNNGSPAGDASAATDAVLEAASVDTLTNSAELGSAENEAERLRVDLEEARARLLRAQADLENFRKRMRRELDDERRYAALPLLSDLLPVIDNVGRAVQAAEKGADSGALL